MQIYSSKKQKNKMKKLISRYWLVLVALVSVCMLTACSSDDDDAVTPVFPQVQTIAGAAGDVKEFTFDANESWSLSSNKIWCKIAQNDAEKGFVINGTAGKQTVKVTLTDDDASKDLSVAQLNLKMGGQEVTIAEIHRSAAGYELKVYVRTSPDADPIDITETGIEAGYNKYSKFYVESNFRFAVTNTPEWVELEGGFMVGVPNKQVAGGVMFKEGVKNAKYAIDKSEGESITFASQDGKAEVTILYIIMVWLLMISISNILQKRHGLYGPCRWTASCSHRTAQILQASRQTTLPITTIFLSQSRCLTTTSSLWCSRKMIRA